MAVFWIGMLVFSFYASTHMVAAGDTWVALACGRHHLDHGVTTVEPFSFNSHNPGPTAEEVEKWPQPFRGLAKMVGMKTLRKIHPTGWVNQNWGTHVTFYWLAKTFGADGSYNYNMLVVWKFAVSFLAAFAIYALARTIGTGPALSAVAAACALVVGRSFIDIRPAVYSNLLVPCVLLVLALSVYRNVKYIWLMVPLAVFWGNVHGGYIYIFIVMVPFIGLHFLGALPRKWSVLLYTAGAVVFFVMAALRTNAKAEGVQDPSSMIGVLLLLFAALVIVGLLLAFGRERLHRIPLKNVIHLGFGYMGSLLAVVVFNPYHLTNLTHTWIISISKNAESWRKVNEWHPAFDRDNPVGDEEAFLVMYIVAWLIFAAWMLIHLMRSRQMKKFEAKAAAAPAKPAVELPNRTDVPQERDIYTWPKIDLGFITVVILTVYMAIASRRFIPIAAGAACPLIALMLEQSIKMVLARHHLRKFNEPFIGPMPAQVRNGILIGATVIVVGFGIYFGAKFHRIYLSPWISDARRDSIFMRMTVSNLKPFDVGAFIRNNQLSGRMFNYWTEGGALAFFEQPDPQTGEISLKLFMDGRAQAAYDHNTFLLWSYIHGGGPAASRLMAMKRSPTRTDYEEIGEWISQTLQSREVWVVVMPSSQNSSFLMRGLGYMANWRPVYSDDDQTMLIDVESEKGKELYNRVMNEEPLYPDAFSQHLSLAENMIKITNPEVQKRGFEHALKAFELFPCRSSAIAIMLGSQVTGLSDEAVAVMKDYLGSFYQNKDTLAKEGGYGAKLTAATLFCQQLSQLTRGSDPDLGAQYRDRYQELGDEYKTRVRKAIW